MDDSSAFEAKIALAKAQMMKPGAAKAYEWLVPQHSDAEPYDIFEGIQAIVYATFENLVDATSDAPGDAQLWHDFLQDALAECISKKVEKSF